MADTYHLLVCPVHGPLSEREAEDAFEMGTDYWGEPCGPYGCPISVRVPVPTTGERTCMQGFVGGPLREQLRFDDPGWLRTDCCKVLEEREFSVAGAFKEPSRG